MSQTNVIFAQAGGAMETLRPSHYLDVPLDDWVGSGVDWLVGNFRPAFQAIKWPVDQVLNGLDALLQAVPFVVMVILFAILAWRVAGRGVAIFTVISFIVLDLVGVWPETMTTLGDDPDCRGVLRSYRNSAGHLGGGQ